MNSCIKIVATNDEIEWHVSGGEDFAILVSPDSKTTICGTEESVSTFANSILIALAAKKVTEIANV